MNFLDNDDGYENFEDLPIFLLDKWEDYLELDEKKLENIWNEYIERDFNYEKMKFSYWQRLDGFLFNSNEMIKLSLNDYEEFETLKINNDPIEVKVMFYTWYNEKYQKFVIQNSLGSKKSPPKSFFSHWLSSLF